MNKAELIKAVELELQWLRYYSYSESKKNLDFSKSLYLQLEGIGYAKKNIVLDKRCAFLRLTSTTPICHSIPLDHLFETDFYRDNENNIFTAMEVFLILFPEEKEWVLERLL